MPRKTTSRIQGTHAVLGMDIVSFSMLSDDDQVEAIKHLLAWVKAALAFQRIDEEEYRWSPAGDGGYLTFKTPRACERAIDVAFAIFQHLERPEWVPTNMKKLTVRMALHAGTVSEEIELGGYTNIWGHGINTTARILSICAPSQVLTSETYYENYVKDKRQGHGLEFDPPYCRTVKHGVQVRVRNVSWQTHGLNQAVAKGRRWHAIARLWHKTKEEYEFLLKDALDSGDPIAALGAARFLLDLGEVSGTRASGAAEQLFATLSSVGGQPAPHYPLRTHPLLSQLPAYALKLLIESARLRIVKEDEIVCREGDIADSCFFVVSGNVLVEGESVPKGTMIGPGEIMGEFALWIPTSRRTAQLKALDEGLLLEIKHEAFRTVADQYADLAEGVYGVIKHRLLENVIRQPALFPGLPDAEMQSLSKRPSLCQKHVAGEVLDLRQRTFVLYSGRLRIKTPGGQRLDITARGGFGAHTVAGIVTGRGTVDGDEASVSEDSVTVSFPHKTLLGLQSRYQEVRVAWDAVRGIREGMLHGVVKPARRAVPARA